MDEVKEERIFNMDAETELEFLTTAENPKTVIIIDKDRFSVCKRLLLDSADDFQFAEVLNIPVEKVRYFKYKMQLFEDSIRTRRREAKLKKRRKIESKANVPRRKNKREISSEDRFKMAKELIDKNYSTNQISKVLKVSERSVTRFKRKIREERMQLKAAGKIKQDPYSSDEDNSFKFMKTEDKIKRAQELFKKKLKIAEISEILKISERSVRRWKDRLSKMPKENGSVIIPPASVPTKKLRSSTRSKTESTINNDDNDDDKDEATTKPTSKKRKLAIDREKLQYAKELFQNHLSFKEMAKLLDMSIGLVRRLKKKILDNTIEELIDPSLDTLKPPCSPVDDYFNSQNDLINNPLNLMEPIPDPTSKIKMQYGFEKKPKTVLGEKEMLVVKILRERNVRTMDIAKMMEISERSVTRLLAKGRDVEYTYDQYVLDEADRLEQEKDAILGNFDTSPPQSTSSQKTASNDKSKRQLGLNLLEMNVTIKDVAKMLDVTERSVRRWKCNTPGTANDSEDDDGHGIFKNLLDTGKIELNEENNDD
ncbi:unnamed protein product [Diamesa serratosioi]